MIAEMIYTSAPRGLTPGSSGFTTVAHTEGLPNPLVVLCEALSAYRHVFPPGSRDERLNPVLFSHAAVTSMGKDFSILSRVSACGLDYSGRTNKLANHIILEPPHRVPQGPAAVLGQPGLFRSEWSQPPEVLDFCPWFGPVEDPASFKAEAWQVLTGWAGWAGLLAANFIQNPRRPACILFEPGMNLLPLVIEAVRLLPPSHRWRVTFSTYFTVAPQASDCAWRFGLASSDFAQKARKQADAFILDLTRPQKPEAIPDHLLIRCAESGDPPDWRRLAEEEAQPPAASPVVRVSSNVRRVSAGPSSPARAPEWKVQTPSRRPFLTMAGILAGFVLLGLAILVMSGIRGRKSPPPENPKLEPILQAEDAVPAPPSSPPPEAVVPDEVPMEVSTDWATTTPSPAPEPASAAAPAPPPPGDYSLIVPVAESENPNRRTLKGLPSELGQAERFEFYSTPGYRVVRTNGSLSAHGISLALAGRKAGEMSLLLSHPQLGADVINLVLRNDILSLSARAEWLDGLAAIEFDPGFENRPAIVLCAAPLRIPSKAARFSPGEGCIVLPIGNRADPELAARLLRSGEAGDWSARVILAQNYPLPASATPLPELLGFRLQLEPADVEHLHLLRDIRDRQNLREQEATPDPLSEKQWARLRMLASDWKACGLNLDELVAPLKDLAATEAPAQTQSPLPPLDPAGDPVELYRSILLSAPSSQGSAAMDAALALGNQRLRQAVAPIGMLETGERMVVELSHGGRVFLVTESP